MRCILVFSVLLCNIVYSQTFEKHYRSEKDQKVLDVVFMDSGTVLFPVIEGIFGSGSKITRLFIMDINTGEFLDSTKIEPYGQPYFLGLNNIFKYADSLYVGIGWCGIPNTNEVNQYIVHLNEELQVQYDTVVDIQEISQVIYSKSILTNDNKIVNVGGVSNNQNLLITEKNIYGGEVNYLEFEHVNTFTATDVINIEQYEKYHVYPLGAYPHVFDIVNKEPLQHDTVLSHPTYFLPWEAVENPGDTSFYYVAGEQYSNGMFNLSYIKVSTEGETLAHQTYPMDSDIYYWGSFVVAGEFLYCSATYPYSDASPILYPEQRWIMLYKLYDTGEVVWQKFYKGEVNYSPSKTLATPDGGLLIFSTRYDWNDPIPNQRDIHILKIDSNGYYTPLTRLNEFEEEQRDKQVLVYPNPCTDQVNFVFGLYSRLEISIYNSSGQLKHRKIYKHSATIDVSGFSAGIYTYIIKGENGFLERAKIIKQ